MITSNAPLKTGKHNAASCYKAVHEHAPAKPGVVFWMDVTGEIFYWRDLIRVVYNPNEEDLNEESVLLVFRLCDITIRGHGLTELFLECQNLKLDWIKVSPDEMIMRGQGPIISDIAIKEVKVGK